MIEVHNRNRRRWGIVYSPKLGALRSDKRWKEIREYLQEKGVEFEFAHAGDSAAVESCAKLFADNGYDTVVVVGGDGALYEAVNGIMMSENRDNVCLGIIPNGIANDFAAYWGLSYGDYKMAVDCIIARRVRKVDLGCCTYNTDRGVQKRYFLNVLNIGLSAKIVEVANKNNTIFSKLVYKVCGFVYLLFRRQNFHMRFKLNSQVVDKRFMMLCIGNSTGYGMTPSAVPYNGWIDVSAIKMAPFLGMLEGMRMLMKRRILNFKRVEPFRTTEICIESVDNALAGIDGRLFYPTYPMTVTAEPEKLNLIIPTKINRKL